MESEKFENIEIERSEHDWIHCNVKESVFNGYGGPENLEELIKIFLEWSGSSKKVQK